MTEPEWPCDEAQARADVRHVVASLLQHHELESVDLAWLRSGESPTRHGLRTWGSAHGDIGLEDDEPDVLWVITAAGGEIHWYSLWTTGCDWRERLWHLGDELQEWISETRFGWGQLRPFELPFS